MCNLKETQALHKIKRTQALHKIKGNTSIT